MDHYLDIQLVPDPEFASAHLMNALFAKLHRALVRLRSDRVGVSFPQAADAGTGLGACLRLHGEKVALDALMTTEWLTGMRDHIQLGAISPVPAWAAQQTVRRVQAKSSAERIRRRQMKRKGWTAEQARVAIPDSVAESLTLPHLSVRSQSSGQTFRLFLTQRPAAQTVAGKFNAYGLSTAATLPKF